jgi:hypothetical protein
MKTTTLFCTELKTHRVPGGIMYDHFFPNTLCVRMCGEYEILKVQVTADPDPAAVKKDNYWGYWDNEKETFTMVYYSRIRLNMCFPYGPEVYEQRGEGICVPVKVEVLERGVK